MERTKKNDSVVVPKSITLLVEAINCDNPDAARLLVHRAMLLTHRSSKCSSQESAWSEEDLDATVSLIRGIKPKDAVESILAAQFVALHLKGMETISEDNYNTMGQAMMMIRLSHQSLNTLQQYRGKSQTINVNYNVHSEGDAVLNTLINHGGDKTKNGG
jgi:hypothetical protein